MSAEALPPPPDSLFYKVRYTPLRDILRGKLTARLDLARIIDNAGLPPELSEIVRTTIKRIRLRWGEKADVARELVAHFRDGIESGALATDLAATFGDIKVAAALIRRAKVIKRPMWRPAMLTLKIAAAALALATVTYLATFIYLRTGTIRVQRNFTQEWKSRLASLSEAERAWPVYREAFLQLTSTPNEVDLRDRRPGTGQWAFITQHVADNQRALSLALVAASRPTLGSPLTDRDDLELLKRLPEFSAWPNSPARLQESENPPLMYIRLPELNVLRRLARLVRCDALVAMNGGDSRRAHSDIDALISMAMHVGQNSLVISDLTSDAIFSEALQLVVEALDRHAALFDDGQLLALAHRIAGFRGGGPLRLRLTDEKNFFDDALQRLFTDDGKGGGHIRPDQLALLDMSIPRALQPFLILTASRTETVRKHAELWAELETNAHTPLWELNPSHGVDGLDRESQTMLGKLRFLPLSVMMPSLTRAVVLSEYVTQRRDAALVAIALELYRREHGRYPTTLEALAPRFLPTVPPDRFDGRPMKYRLVEGKPVLYSVGVNREDDGGVLIALPKPRTRGEANKRAMEWYPQSEIAKLPPAEQEQYRGDWILWPPVED